MTPERDRSSWAFATRAIHVGQEPEPATGAVTVPIYQTATFAQEGVGQHRGYEYARTGNPTRTALEQCVASLESGHHGLAFSSGMGAEAAITYLLQSGDHIVAHDDLYGGTSRLFNRLLSGFGVQVDYVDATDPANVARALRPTTRLVWLETPTNPLLRIVDITAVVHAAHAAGALVVVDNTFASPYFQRPLELGADVVVHSATKYLGGHSDVVLGVLVTRDAGLAERLRFIQNAAGAVPGPFDCWLVLRGLKTLALRMRQHEANAQAVARFLQQHPRLVRVLYPGLVSHPGHAVAARQMTGFGGMVSAEVEGGRPAAYRVLSHTRLFTLAESLGGVESLIEHPGGMTHASVPPERRAAIGIGDGLIRLSVGIEDEADLLADLEQALRE
ncbi:MAG TPA: cystathionine gamma-synthase [Chloroflexota bacterium]|nr:cystathionine gamma-synthase [Chloroflexota bacterium]